jgi:hypothetical protein
LDAYLIVSADAGSVTMIGAVTPMYSEATRTAADCRLPMTSGGVEKRAPPSFAEELGATPPPVLAAEHH